MFIYGVNIPIAEVFFIFVVFALIAFVFFIVALIVLMKRLGSFERRLDTLEKANSFEKIKK